MRKKLILISVIVILAISFYSLGDKKSDDAKVETESSKTSPVSKKDLLVEEEEKDRLKDLIMPTIDIVTQISDSAKGVLIKETNPDIAVSIYSSAGNFLTKKKLELNDLKTPTDDMIIVKDRVLALLDDCISELDLLTDVTKSNDSAMIEGSIAVFLEKTEELRSIAGLEDSPDESTD